MNSPLQQDNWIGRRLGERQRYRIEAHLGSGGMGDVFVARDTLLGKQVALKLLKDTLVESAELKKRFEREVRLCAALKSDHIVSISDYGITDDECPFYVMDYLQGQSLGQLLRQQQRLDIERTMRIITQVCEGLCLAHRGVALWQNGATTNKQLKIIHRDLKPDNIFLVSTALGELVKILDFGIAKICNDSAEFTNLTNLFVGTFHYAAPEQFELGAEVDERVDIYSLGVILYELLSGTDPFGLKVNRQENTISGMSWVFAHAAKPAVPLRSQPGCGHFTLQLEAIVMRCLQKSPQDRFASVNELNLALQAAAAIELQNTSTTVSSSLPQFHSSFDKKNCAQTPNLPGPSIPDAITDQTPLFEHSCDRSTDQRSLTPPAPRVTEALSSPQQDLLLKIFTEFAGPIAPAVFRQVLTVTSSPQELIENLAQYLSLNQRIEFEKKTKALQAEVTVKPQIKPQNAPQIKPQNALSLNQQALDDNFIHQCQRDLIDLIGPIATFLIQRVLKSHSQISTTEFVKILAREIPDPQKANDFCRRYLN